MPELRLRALCAAGCVLLAFGKGPACHCLIPTPCFKNSSNASEEQCLIPTVGNILKCPSGTSDCRDNTDQVLCELEVKPKANFKCWTKCSSMALRRSCGTAPKGFMFEKTGEQNSTECHDPFNKRDECRLRKLHIKARTVREVAEALGQMPETIDPGSPLCPKHRSDLVDLFDRVDGNGASLDHPDDHTNHADGVISAGEALDSIGFLVAEGHNRSFLINDFHKIDADGNHKVSWYELEYYCGHRGWKMPADNITEVEMSNLGAILSNPLSLAWLLSSFVMAELFGVVQVVMKHACRHWDEDQPFIYEGVLVKGIWTLLCHIWPAVYVVMQWWNFLEDVQWEICDEDQHAKPHFAIMLALYTVLRLFMFIFWARRRCPLSPTKDLERRAFMEQVIFRDCGKVFAFCFKTVVCCGAFWALSRAIFFGDIGADILAHFGANLIVDIDLQELDRCKREDPDLAILFKVNQKYFLWNVFTASFLSVYCILDLPLVQGGRGHSLKLTLVNSYRPLIMQSEKDLPQDKLNRCNQEVSDAKKTWEWFE